MGSSAPVQPSVAECDAILTAPGQVLEMETIDIQGRKQRVWKNLPRTFREFFLESFEKYHNREFISSLIDTETNGSPDTPRPRHTLTFQDIFEKANISAAWMRSRKLGIGSRIAIGGNNRAEWVINFVAIHLIGGVAVCLNSWLPTDQLLHCLSKTQPHLILLDRETLKVLLPHKKKLRDAGIGEIIDWTIPQQATLSKTELSDIFKPLAQRVLHPESDAVIFFSSGTSGLPKAVLSTQRSALSNIFSGLVAPGRAAIRANKPIPPLPKTSDPQKVVLLAIPLFHVTGCLSWLLRAFFGGSKIVMMSKWSVGEAVDLIMKEKVTVIGGVPAVVASILHSPHLPRDRGFETVFYGGAPPSKQLAGEVKARWPSTAVVQGYGLTETNAYVCSIAGPDYLSRPESTGPPVPISDLKIVDPTTRKSLPTGQTGLLLVRGPQVMKEYYNDPISTSQAVDSEGWLDTGDAGYLDAEGYLYIKDRLKDIIIRGGENIPSLDVENALCADSRVFEAVAIGVPDKILGEQVGAIVSLHPGIQASESDILEKVKPILGRRACPVIVMITNEPLARNVNGKIVKKDLRPMLVKAWEERQSSITSRKGLAKL